MSFGEKNVNARYEAPASNRSVLDFNTYSLMFLTKKIPFTLLHLCKAVTEWIEYVMLSVTE